MPNRKGGKVGSRSDKILREAWNKMPERARDFIKIEDGSITVTFQFINDSRPDGVLMIDMIEFMKLVYEEAHKDPSIVRSIQEAEKYKMTILKLQEAIHWQADLYNQMTRTLLAMQRQKGDTHEG